MNIILIFSKIFRVNFTLLKNKTFFSRLARYSFFNVRFYSKKFRKYITIKDENQFVWNIREFKRFFSVLLSIKKLRIKRINRTKIRMRPERKWSTKSPSAVTYVHISTITEGGSRGRYGATERRRIRNYSIVARGAAFDASFFHRHRHFVECAEEATYP